MAFVHQLRREPARALPYAQELVALASEEGMTQWIAFGKTVYAWSLAKRGNSAAGIAELRAGLAACEASNTSISRPHFLGMFAEALVEAGEIHEALTILDESLRVSQHASDRYYESELYRFKGELLLTEEDRERRKMQPIAAAAAAAEECLVAQLKSPKANRRSGSNYALPLASAGCIGSKVKTRRSVRCSYRSLTGLLRGSRHRIYWRQVNSCEHPAYTQGITFPERA